MKTLVLDTSSSFLYVCFMENEMEIYKKIIEGKNNHSENLIRIIEEGLNLLNIEVKDFNRIIIGVGPGSYTGLRVSMTVAKIFSWTLNIPLYTASSLDLLGSGYLNEDGIYAITLRAKKNYLYAKLIEVNNGIQRNIINDSFIEDNQFFNMIKEYNFRLIDDKNYLFKPNNVIIKLVNDLHPLTPNYIQREV